MAKEFLATKERCNYYDFSTFDWEHHAEVIYCNPLTDEDVAALRALKEKYGNEFVKHLVEVFKDPDLIHDMAGGEDIIDIDLVTIHHMYTFMIHELRPNGTLYDLSCLVKLKDEEYAELLAWHLYDDHFTINVLRREDSILYDTIMRQIDHRYYDEDGCYCIDYPYVPTLDEALTDTETILSQHNIKRSGGYRIS